ncbi:hypothetical protein V1512DRAFT_260270 [Lipomyces arxii]|uniref:uncharacterized protein n=1 Tax=Lipomyces arxii TaxID=56418 RepID=UPI0034CDB201
MSFYNPAQHPLVRQTNESQQQRDRESSLLTGSSSGVPYADEEWILFSAGESSLLIDDEDDTEGEEHGDDTNVVNETGTSPESSFAFPKHDGHGSFIATTPTARQDTLSALSRTSSSLSEDVAARVNAWRVDQSEHLLRELRRFQTRSIRPRLRSDSISSWGIPAEEDDESDLDDSTLMIASRPLASSVLESEPYSSIGIDGVTESLTTNTHLEHSLSLNDTQSSQIYSPPSMQSHTSPQPAPTFWQRFTRRVIHDIMGLNDDVLDVFFGDPVSGFMTPPATSVAHSEKSCSVLSSTNSKKYWEDKLLARIGLELSLRYCKDYGSVEICNGLFT